MGFDSYSVSIISEEQESEDDYINFQDAEKEVPVLATTVDLLTTGVDVPAVKNIVFMKPVASKIVFKQIVGRGSRNLIEYAARQMRGTILSYNIVLTHRHL